MYFPRPPFRTNSQEYWLLAVLRCCTYLQSAFISSHRFDQSDDLGMLTLSSFSAYTSNPLRGDNCR